MLDELRKAGFVRVRVDGEVRRSRTSSALDKSRSTRSRPWSTAWSPSPASSARLSDSVETALRNGEGTLIVAARGPSPRRAMSQHRACHHCGISFPELTPQLFSFN